MVKPSCCDKIKMQTKEVRLTEGGGEDAIANWTTTPMPKKSAGGGGGVRRSSCGGKSCRVRWNQRPDPAAAAHGLSFTPEEEDLIIKLHAAIGSRWPIIAQQLPGRSDNDVKNIWNIKLKKKLSALGIDPVTHRPFSQILADYGNIGGFPKARSSSGFGCLSRDVMKNAAFGLKPSDVQYSRSPPPDIRSSYFTNNIHFGAATTSTTSTGELPASSKQQQFMNDNICGGSGHQSHELLSQLQAITMVTEAASTNYAGINNTPTMSPSQMMEVMPAAECSSSSASSSPTESANQGSNIASPTPSFSWCDFLLEDAFVPEKLENETKLPPSDHDLMKSKENRLCVTAAAGDQEEVRDIALAAGGGGSAVVVSFVEAMLEAGSTSENDQMLSDFNGLLEEPFYF